MASGVSYTEALTHYRPGEARLLAATEITDEELLRRYHPDYHKDSQSVLQVGPNRGDTCQHQIVRMLQSNSWINDVDLTGVPTVDTDVLVVGGGGAGSAAALTAAGQGARVLLTTKLRLGDSNTVMAEGGMQAAVGENDTPQKHYEDTLRAGDYQGNRQLVAQMVMDGPGVVRWLTQQGMQFDVEGNDLLGGDLLLKQAGGASAARILSHKDYTGLEMMRVLKEAVAYCPNVEVWEHCPVVELLSNEYGHCAGAVIYHLELRVFMLVRAKAVILATGGSGRLHLNDFPTSNHYGATGDGLVLAYRLGAKLRGLDSFQYHPTGIAYPKHLTGGLISEAARSAGAHLLNGSGQRFVNELQRRDIVSAAIIRECEQGRGILADDGVVGVWLDVPTLEQQNPGILKERLVGLLHLAKKSGIDPTETPFLVYPTLHFQNGGILIDKDAASTVPGLLCVGEVSGGIHGRNRLMGNALLEIISFGRRAGAKAAERVHTVLHRKVGIEHIHNWQRELMWAGLPLDEKGPPLFPEYTHFDLRQHRASRERASAGFFNIAKHVADGS